MANRLFGLLMALASARLYSGCKQFPARSDNRLGEIAQIQLVFTFLYALLLKLDTGADNHSSYDNDIFDNLMAFVSLSGIGIALFQPAIVHLVVRCGGKGDQAGIAEYSGSGDMQEVLQETVAAAGKPNQLDLNDVAAGAEPNQVDDDIEMGSSVQEARPEAREAEGQSGRPKQVELPKLGLKGRLQTADSVQTPPHFSRELVGTSF